MALELHCGPEPGNCLWGGERADLLDSFDSEMQEWEDQLQDMQKKIEELYNEVKARREANESSTNNKSLDITLLPVSSQYSHRANGYHEPHGHPNNNLPIHQCNEVTADPSVMQSLGFHPPSDYCNGSNNYMLNSLSNGSHHPASCHAHERQDATLEILNGYLQQGQHFGKTPGSYGPPNANPKMCPVAHSFQDHMKTSSLTNRTASGVALDEFEEAENKKNKKSSSDDSQARHVSWKSPVLSNDLPPKTSKLAIRQRDASPVTPRSTYQESSQQPDRKCLVLDRKSGSPSVLRKFGAMLQENEGKTLIEDGLVTTVVPTEPLRNTSTPICQRKIDARRASIRGPVQKSLVDCDVLVPELESSQKPWAAGPSRNLQNGERDSGRGGCTLEQHGLSYNLSPSQSHLKSACHMVGIAGSKVHKAGFQGEDLFSDYQMVERILGAGSQNFSKVHKGLSVDTMRQGTDNLEQLLEMMEMENNRSHKVTFTQQLDTKQVKHESSPAPSSSNFARPARPANQRRPSRWAKHTPPSNIHTSCPPSPGLKAKRFLNSYSRQTETVIM